jgi:type II secretory pathway predicted ATPase ExeA
VYLNHFSFKSKPFAMSPDPAFLYESQQHAAALTMLEYAMESHAQFCLLTGEIGSGKTTLVRRLIRMLGDRVTVGLVSNTHGRFRSIHPWALSALNITPRDTSEISHYEALNEFFIGEYAKGRRTLLIFDEAQNLSIRTLEELRLLSNVNSESDVVLQTILVGQPELRAKMGKPDLRQFAQRIAVDFHLNALTLGDTEAYIWHRLAVAGRGDGVFHRKAIKIIHEHSGGIPRLINQLCDLSLVYAYAEQALIVNADIVEGVIRDRTRYAAGKVLEPSAHGVSPTDPDATHAQSRNDGIVPQRA